MDVEISDYFDGLVENTKDTFCEILNEPSLWSREIVSETLKRSGCKPFNIIDVQQLVRDYLAVLSETIKENSV